MDINLNIYIMKTFLCHKIKDSIASIIGDKDIVDYNNILSIKQDFSKFEEILDQIFSLNIKIFQIFSISENSSAYTLLCNEKLQKTYSINFQKRRCFTISKFT